MDGLIRKMETEPLDPISHFPTILVSVLNRLIVRHNLNSRRQYMYVAQSEPINGERIYKRHVILL